MSAGGDFRHDAAEGCVFADLRQHNIGQDATARVTGPLDQGGGGFVASSFNAENDHRCTMT